VVAEGRRWRRQISRKRFEDRAWHKLINIMIYRRQVVVYTVTKTTLAFIQTNYPRRWKAKKIKNIIKNIKQTKFWERQTNHQVMVKKTKHIGKKTGYRSGSGSLVNIN
jgi:hypothetical protein